MAFNSVSEIFAETVFIKVVDKNGSPISGATVNVQFQGVDENHISGADGFIRSYLNILSESQNLVLNTTAPSSLFNDRVDNETIPVPGQQYLFKVVLTGTNHKFLTTRPAFRYFYPEQEKEFIRIQTLIKDFTDLSIKLFYLDGSDTTITVDVSFFQKSECYEVQVVWAILEALDPLKTITHFEVFIDEAIDKLTYIVKNSIQDNPAVFFYQNSLGGVDSLVCDGDQVESMQFESIVGKFNVPKNYKSTFAQFRNSNHQATDLLTFNTGNKSLEGEIKALKDMLMKNNIYQLFKPKSGITTLRPLQVVGTSASIQTDWTNLKQLSFQVSERFERKFYSRPS